MGHRADCASMRAALFFSALLAASFAAGCADDDTGPAASAPSDIREPRIPPTAWANLTNVTLAGGGFDLAPGTSRAEVSVNVPDGAAVVTLRIDFTGGVIRSFTASLDGCALDIAGPAPATEQSVTKDCGAMGPGARVLAFDQPAGGVSGRYLVEARMCQDSLGRPSRVCPGSA